MDFFGRSDLELAKKKSFARVSGDANVANSAHLQGATNAGILDFKFACFLTINSSRTTNTFEDNIRGSLYLKVTTNRSGNAQKSYFLNRIPLITEAHVNLIIATGFCSQKPPKGITTNFAGEPIT